MKLVILNDNVGAPGLLNDWGWSAYIDTGEVRVLFDADTRPEVIEYNAERLGVDFSMLDYAVLSHFHHDHYGGFPAVARKKPGLTVYTPPGDIRILRDYGLNPVPVYEPVALRGGIHLSGPLRGVGYDLYEQAAAVATPNGIVVVVGCSHPGADRLAERLWEITGRPIVAVIGGFHSPSRRTLDNLIRMARFVCPAHCSGDNAKEYVRSRAPDKYCEVRTGTVLRF